MTRSGLMEAPLLAIMGMNMTKDVWVRYILNNMGIVTDTRWIDSHLKPGIKKIMTRLNKESGHNFT